MYILKSGIKKDPVRFWPGVFLRDAPLPEFHAERVIPAEGFAGNHIFVTDGVVAFDHHGYSLRNRLLAYHTNGWAKRSAAGWNCRLEGISFDLLDGGALNAHKMLGPDQYLHDPIIRARRYLDRVGHVKASARARAKQRIEVPI